MRLVHVILLSLFIRYWLMMRIIHFIYIYSMDILRSRPGTLSHYLKKIFNCPYVSLFYFYRISLSLVHFLRERQEHFLSCLISVLHLDENKQVASFELCSIVIKFMYSLWPSFLGSNGNEWRNPLAKVLRQPR